MRIKINSFLDEAESRGLMSGWTGIVFLVKCSFPNAAPFHKLRYWFKGLIYKTLALIKVKLINYRHGVFIVVSYYSTTSLDIFSLITFVKHQEYCSHSYNNAGFYYLFAHLIFSVRTKSMVATACSFAYYRIKYWYISLLYISTEIYVTNNTFNKFFLIEDIYVLNNFLLTLFHFNYTLSMPNISTIFRPVV